MPGSAIVYLGIALSGLCALAAEAIWTRLLGLLFGASVYAFSIILAVFLAGLGIGSGIGSFALPNGFAPADRVGLVSDSGSSGDGLDSLQSGRVAPLLARQPVDLVGRLVSLSAGPCARVLGPVAADGTLGRELSLCASRCRSTKNKMPQI